MANEAVFTLKLKDEFSAALGKSNLQLEATAQKLKDIGEANKHMEELRQSALLGGAAIGAMIGASVKSALDLENQLTPVKSLLSGTAEEVSRNADIAKKKAQDWSSAHKDGTDKYMASLYQSISAGLDFNQALAATEQSLILATGTLGEAAQATELLTGLYNNLGNKSADTSEEMQRLADITAKTQQLFAISNLDQLAQGFAKAASGANTYGVNVTQTAAVVGQLNTAMIKGPEAGTSFNAMLAQMSKASSDLGFRIAYLGDGSMDLINTIGNIKAIGASGDALQKAFGQEGLRAVSALTVNYEALQKNVKEVANSLGSSAEAAKRVESSPANQMAIALNKLVAIGGKIGGVLLPPLMLAGSAVMFFLDGVNWALDIFPPLRIVIAATGVALTGLLLTFGGYVMWAKMAAAAQIFWNTQMIIFNAVNPFAWIALGIAAVVAGIFLLIKHWSSVVGKIKEIRDMIAVKLVQAWLAFWGQITKYFTTEYWNGLGQGIMVWFQSAGRNIVSFFQAAFSGEFWAGLWQGMIDSFGQALRGMWEKITKWWADIVKLAKGESVDAGTGEAAQSAAKPTAGGVSNSQAIKAVKIKTSKSSSSGGETDWGMNAEFLAANGLGGPPVKASAKTIDTARAGVQNITHNKGGAVDNSRSIHIANVNIDGANITDFETFKLELMGALA